MEACRNAARAFRDLWKLVAALQKPSAICGVMSQYRDVSAPIVGRMSQYRDLLAQMWGMEMQA